jgi:large subunit ribosomal protein L31
MKQDIHPTYYELTAVCTSCGATYETGSIRPEIRVEICASCHPVFRGAGDRGLITNKGQVERFNKKYGEIKSSKKK